MKISNFNPINRFQELKNSKTGAKQVVSTQKVPIETNIDNIGKIEFKIPEKISEAVKNFFKKAAEKIAETKKIDFSTKVAEKFAALKKNGAEILTNAKTNVGTFVKELAQKAAALLARFKK